MADVVQSGSAANNAVLASAHLTNTVSVTLPSDCDFIAISLGVNSNLTIPAIVGITVDGVSASAVSGCDTGELAINGFTRLYAYGLANPNTGTINVIATFIGNIRNSVLTVQGYKNVDQTTPTEGGTNRYIDDDGGTTFNVTPSTTTVAGDYLFAEIVGRGNPLDVYCLDNQLSKNDLISDEISFVCGDDASTGSGEVVNFHKGAFQATAGWVYVINQAADTGVTGTVDYTNANDTSVASGTTTVIGSSATTNANDTVIASGSVGAVSGAVNYTNNNDTSSANGTTSIVGTSSTVNNNDTCAASGTAGSVTGTVNYTNSNDIVYAVGNAGNASVRKARKHKFIVEKDGKLQIYNNKTDAVNALNKTIKTESPSEPVKNSDVNVPVVEINQPQSVKMAVLYDISAMLDEISDNKKAQALINQKNYEQFIKAYESFVDESEVEMLLLGM